MHIGLLKIASEKSVVSGIRIAQLKLPILQPNSKSLEQDD